MRRCPWCAVPGCPADSYMTHRYGCGSLRKGGRQEPPRAKLQRGCHTLQPSCVTLCPSSHWLLVLYSRSISCVVMRPQSCCQVLPTLSPMNTAVCPVCVLHKVRGVLEKSAVSHELKLVEPQTHPGGPQYDDKPKDQSTLSFHSTISWNNEVLIRLWGTQELRIWSFENEWQNVAVRI